MSDLVGNPEDRFSYNEAHIIIRWRAIMYIVKRKHVFVLAGLNSECSDTGLGYLESSFSHYANMSVPYIAIFHGCKNDNFQMKIFDIFLIFALNIDCGYTLEPPQRGGSNEYPQSMFWSKNKKNMYTRVNPTFSI